MSDDPGHLALVIAAVNDPATKERLGQLQAVLSEVQAERAAVEAEAEKNGKILADIQEAQRAVEARSVEIIDRELKLKADTEALTGVIASHTAERNRWEEQRQIVDADHAKREAAIVDREITETQTRIDLEQRRIWIEQANAALAEREARHHRRHQAIEAALKVA